MGHNARPGDPWAICDLTGFKVRMSQTRKTWDGLRVWSHVWYPKQPLLSVHGIPDKQQVEDARPEPADVFVLAPGEANPNDGNTYVTAPTWDDME
jgi:hypothetical protein